MSSSKRQRSDAELKQAARYVAYEISQFRWVASWFQRDRDSEWCIPGEMEQVGTGHHHYARNCLLECLLLHTRVLHEFLTRKESSHGDDILAAHFVEEPEKWEAREFHYLNENRVKQIHKALAHLSYTRSHYTGDRKVWDTTAIITEIEAAWNHFMHRVGSTRRKWFEEPWQ